MKVTAIKPDKKHLTKLLLDEDSEIFIDNDVFCESGITTGSHITEEELKKLKYESELSRAKSRALWYLDRMDYTEKALYEKLLKAGFGKRASAAVIARLCELGVIDDRRYAERLAERLKETNVSKRDAMHKMLLKGLPYDLIKEIIDSDGTDEEEKIKNLLEGKYARKLAEEKGAEKVYAALVRKGFSYGAVRTAMKNYTEQLEFCED